VVAAAGVLTSVALAVAMAIMVASFRESVDEWLVQLLPADLYLRAGRAQSSAYLGEELQAAIADTPGIKRLEFTRHEQLRLGDGQAPVALIARPCRPMAAACRWSAGRSLPACRRYGFRRRWPISSAGSRGKSSLCRWAG
jgi:hypothetical protein